MSQNPWEEDEKASPEAMNRLKEFLRSPENRYCADCSSPEPKWASTNLGVFICIKCSGVHRSLGVHISKVLSVTLDDWTDDQIELMIEIGGNTAANATYEAYPPADCKKPTPDASVEQRTEWIRRKYEDQEFLKPALRLKSSATLKAPADSKNSSRSSPKSFIGRASTFRSSKSLSRAELDRRNTMGMVEFIGLLKVFVERGRDLAVRDVRTSDPYVVATIGQQTLKTTVIRSNLNPVWNEELMLSVPSPPTPLKLQVYDKDTFSRDDIMGEAEVDLLPMVSAARMHEGVESDGEKIQIGRWLSTSDNALISDSSIWLSEGRVTQQMSLKLQNVESGELDIALEWVPLTQ
ncbi:unnamed protein product [Calypogeia fissa]